MGAGGTGGGGGGKPKIRGTIAPLRKILVGDGVFATGNCLWLAVIFFKTVFPGGAFWFRQKKLEGAKRGGDPTPTRRGGGVRGWGVGGNGTPPPTTPKFSRGGPGLGRPRGLGGAADKHRGGDPPIVLGAGGEQGKGGGGLFFWGELGGKWGVLANRLGRFGGKQTGIPTGQSVQWMGDKKQGSLGFRFFGNKKKGGFLGEKKTKKRGFGWIAKNVGGGKKQKKNFGGAMRFSVAF